MKKLKVKLNGNSTWTLEIDCDQIAVIRYALAEASMLFESKARIAKSLKSRDIRSTAAMAKEVKKASEDLEAAFQLAIHGKVQS